MKNREVLRQFRDAVLRAADDGYVTYDEADKAVRKFSAELGDLNAEANLPPDQARWYKEPSP